MGLLYGEYGGRSDEFQPGGASYECGILRGPVTIEHKARNALIDFSAMNYTTRTSVYIIMTKVGLCIDHDRSKLYEQTQRTWKRPMASRVVMAGRRH
ncbi:hypothetical protein E4T50_16509 [Aureobasidium sp. EXF-12298]|nr:hypothetical protein E4T50_16509 [Aureobasidium sp. EXF-12298]KAI4751060.1 hypothetical protein E4T51_15676 [Aureobasidium sp. EXF-12344]